MSITSRRNKNDPKYQKKYRLEHKEQIKQYQKEYHQKHRIEENKKRKQYDLEHREERREYYRKWRLKNPEKTSKLHHIHNLKIRKEIIELLGGECVRCGFSDWRALQVDHINGGGCKERKKLKSKYYKYILQLLKTGNKDYQLLCANCNWIKKYEMGENFGNKIF